MHPIKFNYYDGHYKKAEHPEKYPDQKVMTRAEVDTQSALILLQDLIAAGWQADMAQNWQSDSDPNVALDRQIEIWIAPSEPEFPARFFDIFREQIQEFSLKPMPYVNQPEWMAELKATVVAKL